VFCGKNVSLIISEQHAAVLLKQSEDSQDLMALLFVDKPPLSALNNCILTGLWLYRSGTNNHAAISE
jgi:hypothetical protein